MVLLVGSCRQALPAVPVPASCQRLVLPAKQDQAEAKLRQALEAQPWGLVISMGFAAAADGRLHPGDLVLATRIFGGADVYLDLPAAQAPGAFAGSLSSLTLPVEAPQRLALPTLPPVRRLPPVYAFDDSAFWLARACEAAGRRCMVLRAVVLASTPSGAPDALLRFSRRLTPSSLGAAALCHPALWSEVRPLRTGIRAARRQLATTLTILLMLQEQATRPDAATM